MSLASRLPFRHAYAAGFPGLGSQAVPTDADALDYLDRMAAADGASVEVGVATAVDAFVAALKADSLWDDIGSSCLLCGPRTLAGALVPLRGDAPTAYAFTDGDHSRTAGLTGDGSTTYLDSGRDCDDDPQDDVHLAVYVTSACSTDAANRYLAGGATVSPIVGLAFGNGVYARTSGQTPDLRGGTELVGVSRSNGTSYDYRLSGTTFQNSVASVAPNTEDIAIFATYVGASATAFSNPTIAFYSIGTSLDLAKLDSHVSAYVTAIGAAV